MDNYIGANPSRIFYDLKKLPEWEQTLKRHTMLYRTFNDDDSALLHTVYATMQKYHPGDYILTMDGNDVKLVFKNSNKELMWKIKNT
jgi:hypothetical protein